MSKLDTPGVPGVSAASAVALPSGITRSDKATIGISIFMSMILSEAFVEKVMMQFRYSKEDYEFMQFHGRERLISETLTLSLCGF